MIVDRHKRLPCYAVLPPFFGGRGFVVTLAAFGPDRKSAMYEVSGYLPPEAVSIIRPASWWIALGLGAAAYGD